MWLLGGHGMAAERMDEAIDAVKDQVGLISWNRSDRPRVRSGRPLRLPTPPTAEHAAELAQRVVDAARNVSGIDLDYTPPR